MVICTFFAKKNLLNYLTVENISKSYGELTLFENISFSIHKDEKIAFVAKNGTGKTSILNMLSGDDEPDTGLITYRKDIAVSFLPQDPKLAGLRYTVTGEVNSAGVLTLFQDRVNIIEALANAGDIKTTGDRTDVMVIRQYPQGQKIHHIDLTDLTAMQSPFYYIQPNDMILVKPLKRKAIGAGETFTQTLITVASIFSIIVSTYFLVDNL